MFARALGYPCGLLVFCWYGRTRVLSVLILNRVSFVGCSMALTDAVCRSAKPGPKRRKLSDGGGLQLWVQTSGARLWQLAYRFHGRQRQLALGAYPDLSLAEARVKREDARRLLRTGGDPAAAKSGVAAVHQSH